MSVAFGMLCAPLERSRIREPCPSWKVPPVAPALISVKSSWMNRRSYPPMRRFNAAPPTYLILPGIAPPVSQQAARNTLYRASSITTRTWFTVLPSSEGFTNTLLLGPPSVVETSKSAMWCVSVLPLTPSEPVSMVLMRHPRTLSLGGVPILARGRRPRGRLVVSVCQRRRGPLRRRPWLTSRHQLSRESRGTRPSRCLEGGTPPELATMSDRSARRRPHSRCGPTTQKGPAEHPSGISTSSLLGSPISFPANAIVSPRRYSSPPNVRVSPSHEA